MNDGQDHSRWLRVPEKPDTTRLERWRITREIIAHEDNLTAHRVTWFLTLQGFLFAAVALGMSALAQGESPRFHWVLHSVLCLFAITGILSPVYVVGTMKDAIRQRRAAGVWWRMRGSLTDEQFSYVDPRFRYPPEKGPESNEFSYNREHHMGEHDIWGPQARSSYHVPGLLGIIWVIILCVLIASALSGPDQAYRPRLRVDTVDSAAVHQSQDCPSRDAQ